MKIALDWTPNPMHTGLFVAKHKGWLDLTCISPSVDNYTVMPTDKLLRGEVDFCIGPPEGLIHHHLTVEAPQLLAVAPILEKNTSAFVARENRSTHTVGDWAGKKYAALDLPFEKSLLTAMIEESGENPPEVFVPDKLDTWKMLLNGETDLTWVFLPIEGAEAEYLNLKLWVFRPEDAGIPYPPCPIIHTSRRVAESEPRMVKYLWEMATRGYQFAVDYPEEAARMLYQYTEEEMEFSKLLYIQKAIKPYYYLNGQTSECLQSALVNFVNWLWSRGVLEHKPAVDEMVWMGSAGADPN